MGGVFLYWRQNSDFSILQKGPKGTGVLLFDGNFVLFSVWSTNDGRGDRIMGVFLGGNSGGGDNVGCG